MKCRSWWTLENYTDKKYGICCKTAEPVNDSRSVGYAVCCLMGPISLCPYARTLLLYNRSPPLSVVALSVRTQMCRFDSRQFIGVSRTATGIHMACISILLEVTLTGCVRRRISTVPQSLSRRFFNCRQSSANRYLRDR